MDKLFEGIIERLASLHGGDSGVIPWASPVPFFGDASSAEIATVGINPSNREFMDSNGSPLSGADQRFPTLQSLGLADWRAAKRKHRLLILKSCVQYFQGNPYNTWFKRLERLLSPMGATYYGLTANACHLDLIPFATAEKWGRLGSGPKMLLAKAAEDTLAQAIERSNIQVVVLNGRAVVSEFERLANISLAVKPLAALDLPRVEGRPVPGMGFVGTAKTIGQVKLSRQLLVLGFNHNIQSSYGITDSVTKAIGRWLAIRHGGNLG